MLIYLAKLVLVLALVCGMAVGALWLLRKTQPQLSGRADDRHLGVVESLALSPIARLTVVRFGDQLLLLAHGRAGIETLARQAIEEVRDV